MDKNEIRKKILEALYREYEQKGLASQLGSYVIAREIGVDEKTVDLNSKYLEDIEFIKIVSFGSPKMGPILSITSKGIDFIEGPSGFNPPHEYKSQSIEIKGSIVGQVVQANHSTLNISTFFGHLIQSIQNHPDLPPDEKKHWTDVLYEMSKHPLLAGLVLKSIDWMSL